MIGASKLTEENVIEIKRLFRETDLNNQQIADMFGVSRPHISHIRTGRKWNDNTRSFTMKKELKRYTRTITIINGVRYSTGISPLQTINGDKYAIVHYINDNDYKVDWLVFDSVPDYEILRDRHSAFLRQQTQK